jgi:APA family basic amino acid/polyamine antiporter
MARDGVLFAWLGAVHARRRTPHRAIALQAVWASALVATGTYRELVHRVIYTEWLFFALMAVGLLVLRRRAGYAPAFRVWGHPVTTLLFAACSLLVAASQIVAEPVPSATGLLLVLAGLPAYAWWARRARRPATAERTLP